MRICIPIRETNLNKAKKQVKKALKQLNKAKGEALFEIWLDYLKRASFEDLRAFMKFCQKPVIAVCRVKPEKGRFKGSEKERIEILKKAAAAGAKFIDCGMQTAPQLINGLRKQCDKFGAKLIISKHFWDFTPPIENLFREVQKAKRLGADIVKIATYIKHWADNVILFELVKRASAEGQKIIVVGMGEKGKISRVGCPLLGSYLAYVALDEKLKTAQGQMTVRDFMEFYH